MDRKDFLRKLLQTGIGAGCCGGVLARALAEDRGADAGDAAPAAEGPWIHDLERRMIKGAETPGWEKSEKGQQWIKDLMGNMDALLDPEAKVTLMQACGRSCYIGAFGVAPEGAPAPENVAATLQNLEKTAADFRREGSTVRFTFSWGRDHQNPWGLIMRDGYCMCPIVESGPPGLSPTFCLCSTGYVREIFQRATGKPVDVELVESLKTGGQDCVFRITIRDV